MLFATIIHFLLCILSIPTLILIFSRLWISFTYSLLQLTIANEAADEVSSADDSEDEGESEADEAFAEASRRERRQAYRELSQRVDRVRKMRVVADKMRLNKLLVVRPTTCALLCSLLRFVASCCPDAGHCHC